MTGEYKKIEEIEINGRKRNLYKNKGSNAKFIKCKGKYMKYSDFIRMNKPKSKYNKGGGMFDFFGKKEEPTGDVEVAQTEAKNPKKELLLYYTNIIVPVFDSFQEEIKTFFIEKQNVINLIDLHKNVNPEKSDDSIIKDIKRNISNYLLKTQDVKIIIKIDNIPTCIPIEKYFMKAKSISQKSEDDDNESI